MKPIRIFVTVLMAIMVFPVYAQSLFALTYHDIVETRSDDLYAITRDEFSRHLKYLQKHKYQPISLKYLQKVQQGQAKLPDRAILLTFDDGLESYRRIVIPMLTQHGYPSVLSVVSGWLDGERVPPEYIGKLLDWKTVRELSRLPMVEVLSHSHDLHHGVSSNPQGNRSYAGVTRQYHKKTGRYESERAFRRRIRIDLSKSFKRLETELNEKPIGITWPYGAYDQITASIAKSLGFRFHLTLDEGANTLKNLPGIRRFLVTRNTTAGVLKKILSEGGPDRAPIRFVEFDLQALVDVPPSESEIRLSRLLDRLEDLRVNTVIVSGLTRNNKQTMFVNSSVPVAVDVLNRVLHQIRTRLSIKGLYVRLPATMRPDRVRQFYTDLSRLNEISGIIFHGPGTPHDLRSIKKTVRIYRPKARFGYYGKPASSRHYDFVVLQKNPVLSRAELANQVKQLKKHVPIWVSLVSDAPGDAGKLARAMYELRQQGIENYGYRNLSLMDSGRSYPQLMTELAVKTMPKRATAAEILFFFVFFYPLFMAVFWMMGAVTFFFRREWGRGERPELEAYPHVSILVPCHNEELCINDTIEHLSQNHYPNFEIIAINDGSVDATGEMLEALSTRIGNLRVVTLTENYGKAKALRAGAMASQGEFLMCIDADALLDKDALYWMIAHFLSGPRVGAVTGNPRVINRSGLLARIQIGEFSAIVGMIKRTQRSIGRMFTVSGVNACYRRSAVHNVGYWSSDTVTEDVDISWRLQLEHWDIRYEPKALTWILVPETFLGLWRQRLRWAKGGFEAATHFASDMRAWTSRRMWSVFAEYWLGVIWCYSLAATFLFWAATQILPADIWPASLVVRSLLPGWTGIILALVCLVQFSVGLALDSFYERRGLMRYLFWAIWYPALYWIISAATTVAAIPIGLRNMRKSRSGLWRSPGRLGRPYPEIRRVKHKLLEDERRRHFQKHSEISSPRRATELFMTVLFWGLWSYLITPLISLLLWLAGVYFFTERMITMGGYQALADQLVSYAGVVGVMAMMLAGWVIWNQQRYGRRDKRSEIPRHVSEAQVEKATGLDEGIVDELRRARSIAMHYQDGLPVIEKKI